MTCSEGLIEQMLKVLLEKLVSGDDEFRISKTVRPNLNLTETDREGMTPFMKEGVQPATKWSKCGRCFEAWRSPVLTFS